MIEDGSGVAEAEAELVAAPDAVPDPVPTADPADDEVPVEDDVPADGDAVAVPALADSSDARPCSSRSARSSGRSAVPR